jgi:hypothetical protein
VDFLPDDERNSWKALKESGGRKYLLMAFISLALAAFGYVSGGTYY